MTMRGLSEDDLDLAGMTSEELGAAWDLWFDLSQETNDADPPYSHGVFQRCRFALLEADAILSPRPRVGARLGVESCSPDQASSSTLA